MEESDMSFQIYNWLEKYVHEVVSTFGYRIWFIGVQGSYARGEATEESDIDVVLILDTLLPADLRIYRGMLNRLPYREKICGFISGREELENWSKADLFQFCQDTMPLKGSLNEIVAKLDMADVRRAVHTGACNLYHAACHNMLHEQSREVLMELYKTSVFTIQAEYFLKTGNYLRRKAELFPKLNGLDREILYIAIEMKQKSGKVKGSFDELSEKLIVWSSGLIRQYQGEK
ncbi:nucleotidyltransferase domain-containing protein [Mediterraneibacter gnavus]|jgi:hypothetical protein|uniref:Nucleotidyltransferase domain-containing protein n=2 Tax=Mediterraneibacter gnavus TaxID=33038 RepID=A0A414PCB9_MEDGN|nr:nucleotidyltransferase domain-containing protein [Mediterraneibacter gnavus]RHD06208.1 nucleotidyltransferase domain-containing protein [Mediterraneibacter gnavus]RHF64235.1 nucleotidyltransferase domain-containing protein [Mediterraneibacter gnavus]